MRISLNEEEKRLVVNTGETVLSAKRRLYAAGRETRKDNVGENGDDEKSKVQSSSVPEPARQRWYFSGKLLGDKTKIGDAKIPSGYVVQCVVNNLDFEVIKANSKE